MRQKFRRSLQFRIQFLHSMFIIVFFLLVVITLYFSISILYQRESENNVKQFQSVVVTGLNNLKGNIQSDILKLILEPNIQSILKDYDTDQNTPYPTRELIEEIHYIVNTNNNIEGCDILTTEGTLVKTSGYANQDLIALFPLLEEEPYYPYGWYGPYDIENNNGIVDSVFIVRKNIISSSDGKMLGEIYAYVNENSVNEVFSSFEKYSNSEYLILDRHGNLIAPSNDDEIFSLFQTELEKGMSDGHYAVVGGVDQFVIRNGTDADQWSAVSITSMDSLRQAFSNVQMIMIVVAIVGILLVLLVAGYIAKRITVPMGDMVQTMEQISAGNRELRLQIKEPKSSEFVVVESSFNKLMDRNDTLLKEVYEKQERIRQYNFLLLQEQIKPHFMYNSLSTVSALIKLDMQSEAVQTVDNLASFFRITLNGGKQIYSLLEELEMVGNYLTVQKYRYHGKIEYQIVVAEEIKTQSVPKLTLQPLIENAIYHGARGRTSPTTIDITGIKMDNEILLKVRDNGNGITQEKISEIYHNIESDNRSNFGLTCVYQQLKLLFGKNVSFEIASEKGSYTEVSITLPYHPLESEDTEFKLFCEGK